MLVIIKQSMDSATVLDTTDSVEEVVSLNLLENISEVLDIENISEEQLLLNRMVMGYETIVFTPEDTLKSAGKKIENRKCNRLKLYNLSNITDMCMLFGFMELEYLDLSKFDTSKVTNMSYMFSGCNINTLIIDNLNTSKVIDMSYMFSVCKIQSILNFSSFNTYNCERMECMFEEAEIPTLNLTSFNTCNIKSLRGMFRKCKVNDLDLSSFTFRKNCCSTVMFSCLRCNTIKFESYSCKLAKLLNKTNSASYIFLKSSS